MSRLNFTVRFFVFSLLSLPATVSSAQTTYSINHIGQFPGHINNTPAAINNLGEVVGTTQAPTGPRVYYWHPDSGFELVPLLPGATSSIATDISDTGLVVGRYEAGTVKFPLGWLVPAGPAFTYGSSSDAGAVAVNTDGVVIGFDNQNTLGASVDTWTFNLNGMGAIAPLNAFEGLVTDINDNNLVVGQAFGGPLAPQAYVTSPGGPATGLGPVVPNSTLSRATAINSPGDIAGQGTDPTTGATLGFFLPAGGSMQVIPPLLPTDILTLPDALNDDGLMVGWSGVDFLDRSAFVWSQAAGMVDLNTLIEPTDPLAADVVLAAAIDVNNAGQIVATGTLNGSVETFVLTPFTPPGLASPISVAFSGPLLFVEDDSAGSAVYAGAVADDVWSGEVVVGANETGATMTLNGYFFEGQDYFAFIDDGQTLTSTFGSDRAMEVTFDNDIATTAEDVDLFNSLLGTTLPPGTLVDVIQVETDITSGNRRIEIGLSYVSLDTSLIVDTAYQLVPAIEEVDLVFYFVVEEQNENEVFNALGLVTAQTLSATGLDTDSDGIADEADNCTLRANGPLLADAGGQSQRDSNDDGFGNVCDPDLNDDGIVNVVDLGLLRAVFFTPDADADLNGDGVVNVVDLGIMRALFFSPPGPAGSL